MKSIRFENAPNIKAHYSPAVIAPKGETMYISGQLPINPITREFNKGDIREQTLIALENMEKLVVHAGGSKKDIVKTTCFITDIEHWDIVDDVYSEFFGEHKPSRSIITVKEIHFGFLVEIEGIAII